jgi:hypothetical protein
LEIQAAKNEVTKALRLLYCSPRNRWKHKQRIEVNVYDSDIKAYNIQGFARRVVYGVGFKV